MYFYYYQELRKLLQHIMLLFHVFCMIIYFLIFGFILKVNKCILCYFSLSNLNLQIKNIEILYNPFVLAS